MSSDDALKLAAGVALTVGTLYVVKESYKQVNPSMVSKKKKMLEKYW